MTHSQPVVVTTGTGDLEGVAAKHDNVWKPVEFYVWPGKDQYLGVKRHTHIVTLPDGTAIQLVEWTFVQATPEQLRALADAVEQRQGEGWKERLDPETRTRMDQKERQR